MVSVGSGSSDDDSADRSADSDLDGSIPVDFIQGRGHVQERGSIPEYGPPHEAFRPYVAPPVTRRRKSDWPVLVCVWPILMPPRPDSCPDIWLIDGELCV